MTTPVEVFERVATELEGRHPDVERNRRGSLVLAGRGVCAMTSKGAIVVRLEPGRVRALVASGEGRHYKGQANSWLELADGLSEERCRLLIQESLRR
jgi:hypothetical protein